MPERPTLPPPPFSHPEDVRAAAVREVSARVAAGESARSACAAVGAPLGVVRSTLYSWAREQGADWGPGPLAGRLRNAVTLHLVMSMQRQRDMAQRLLRVIDVRLAGVERQARRGAAKIDGVEVGRIVADLAALHRLDAALMLQVGRLPGEAGEDDGSEAQERAEAVVDEYASEWERDRALFRPPEGAAAT